MEPLHCGHSSPLTASEARGFPRLPQRYVTSRETCQSFALELHHDFYAHRQGYAKSVTLGVTRIPLGTSWTTSTDPWVSVIRSATSVKSVRANPFGWLQLLLMLTNIPTVVVHRTEVCSQPLLLVMSPIFGETLPKGRISNRSAALPLRLGLAPKVVLFVALIICYYVLGVQMMMMMMRMMMRIRMRVMVMMRMKKTIRLIIFIIMMVMRMGRRTCNLSFA